MASDPVVLAEKAMTAADDVTPACVIQGKANVMIDNAGSGVGTVDIQKSFDGTNFFTISRAADGTAASYPVTGATRGFNGWIEETEKDVSYQLKCTAYTSGTINARISR